MWALEGIESDDRLHYPISALPYPIAFKVNLDWCLVEKGLLVFQRMLLEFRWLF